MGLVDAFEEGSPIPDYLGTVASIHREVLGDDLVALCLHGSVVQEDFRAGSSDLDILGVVSQPIGAARHQQLVSRLSHDALPVPAFGLELILCTADAVAAPCEAVAYDFALSTGQEWGTQVETDGVTSDLLVHIQLCRQSGLALLGTPAKDVLAPISRTALRPGLMGELRWHVDDLRAGPNPTAITNAVLNAARSLYAAQTGAILSKTEGGEWWLCDHAEDDPDAPLVADALAFRSRIAMTAPEARRAIAFAERVRSQIESLG